MTMRSLLSKKQNISSARPVRAKMLMVMNHAWADSGVLYTASIFPETGLYAFGAKMAMTRGRVLMINPARLARNMRTLVRTVISLVSRVSDAPSAPYGTLMSVKHMLRPT